jgi:hypothetical protein
MEILRSRKGRFARGEAPFGFANKDAGRAEVCWPEPTALWLRRRRQFGKK